MVAITGIIVYKVHMAKVTKLIDPVMPFSDLPEGMLFTESDLIQITMRAKMHSLDEILLMFGIDSVDDLEADDRRFVKYAHRHGVNRWIDDAADNLFRQMGNGNGVGGTQACLSYLVQFAPRWDQSPDGARDLPKLYEVKVTRATG